uniref:Nuclear protein DGCR14 n=1 Tax=Araucaria cunninghamii TaxID=56994 RepID=A0A0D6QUF8_ARACU
MLSSPGNSPRHILPSPSPSPALTPSSNKTLTLTDPSRVSIPGPLKKRKNSQTVLDEDSYVAAIEKIIERDYFPDIPKLHDRLEWLEAARSGDPMQIRDAQLKIVERRRGRVSGHDNLVTPTSSFRDPFETPMSTVAPSLGKPLESPMEISQSVPNEGLDVNMSLDEFLKRHTSEDNESFDKIIEKVNKRRKEKYKYLQGGVESAESQALIGDGNNPNRITDGYGTSGQPESTLESWNYTPKNLLMYDSTNRLEAPLTKEEREERVRALTKEIKQSNTRFHGNVFESKTPTTKEEDNTVAILYTPVAGATPSAWPFAERDAERAKKKYDLEDLRKSPQMMLEKDGSKWGTAGYSFVRTPSPAPGVDESPFITWGEIEGTPLRLEEEDTPVGIGGSGDGPHFKIPLPPARDVRAYNLSRDAARNIREKSKLYQKPPRIPTPSRNGPASPAFNSLSPAAQKFVRNAMAKSCNSVDATLRASYRASTSPGTPKMARNAVRFEKEGSLPYRPSSLREGSVSARSPTPDL